MPGHRTILRLLVCVLLVFAGVALWGGLHVENSLADLLPGKGDAATEAFDRLARTGSRQVNALFRAEDPETARAAAQKAAEALPASVEVVVPETSVREVAEALMPYRFQLLSRRHRELLQAGGVEALREEALANLYSFVPLLLIPADDDPYGFATSFLLENPALTSSGLAPDGGVLMGVLDGVHYACLPLLLPEDCAGSPTRLDEVMRQVALACGLEEDGTAKDGSCAMLAGVPVHTWLASRESMSAMTVLGAVSTLMVVALFLLVFHSLRGLAIMVLTLACGGVMAMGAVAAVFGGVHLLALVFACSLVGLSTDYMVHYLVAHGREKGKEGGAPMDSGFPAGLTRALLAGFVSTALGYLLFCFSGMALLNQIALLSLTGLGGVVLTMFAFYPWLYRKCVPVRLSGAACRAGRVLGAHACPRWVPWAVAALCAVPCLYLQTNDDLRSFYTPPPHLLEAEKAVARLNHQEHGVLCLLVQGKDAADVLAREESLVDTLRADGMACRAVSSFVPSPERQKKDFDLVQPVVASGTDDLAMPAPEWKGVMTPQELFQASPTFALLEPLWGGTSSLVLVTGGDRSRIEPLIAGRGDVLLVDRFGDLAAGMEAYRLRLLLLLALVLVPAWGILALRRGAWRALVLMGPVVGGVAVVPCALALTGTGLTLFHVLGAFLVVGLGFDYVVFRSEQGREGNLGLAVTLSFLTTLLAFGVLAFTTFSVTRDIGVTISLGLSAAFLLSFAATPRREEPACTASCAEGKS